MLSASFLVYGTMTAWGQSSNQNATMENSTSKNATTSVSTPPEQVIPQDTAVVNATQQNHPSNATNASKILSPRAQVASGVAPTDVKCAQGFSLVLNAFDSRPACIKSEDVASFVARGWGHTPT